MSSITRTPVGSDWEATDVMADRELEADENSGPAEQVAGALVLVRGGEARQMTLARITPRRLMVRALRGALPTLGRVMRVAGPVLLTIATSEVARRLNERPESLPALSSRRAKSRTCEADPATVIVVQIAQCGCIVRDCPVSDDLVILAG